MSRPASTHLRAQRNKEGVAYRCSPFCLFSEEACRLLRQQGFRERELLDGVSAWHAAAMSLAAGTARRT